MRLEVTEKWSRDRLELESIEFGPGGFWTPLWESPSWLLLFPFRRMLNQPWFKPIVRVGDGPFVEYPMGRSGDYVEFVVPKGDSRIYFYINDAVIALPFVWDFSYKRNRGAAKLLIEEVKPAAAN